MSTVRTWLLVLAATVRAITAHAEVDNVDDRSDTSRYLVIVGEAGLELAIPAVYYWRTPNHQSIDWTLHWDADGWKSKLITFERVRFDTNPWEVNSVRHPLAGVLDYDIARANGLGMFGATAFAFVTSAIWEYFVEYREDPSINDMIFNTWGGLGIGEPMYQAAQLWRSSDPSLWDRTHVLLFSPADAVNDIARPARLRRKNVPHLVTLYAGFEQRWLEGVTRPALAIGGEAEVSPPAGEAIKPGAASDIRASARIGDEPGASMLATSLLGTTSLVGRRSSDDAWFGAVGAGFMYRHDRLAEEWDRISAAHLIGGQLAFTSRGALQLKWEAAAYGDFGLIQAHVFGPRPPFPDPPPYRSALQADGYYDALGASGITRLRLQHERLHLDAEASLHRWWQIAGADRAPMSERAAEATTTTTIPVTPIGSSDWRGYWHAQADYLSYGWALGLAANGAYRRGEWQDLVRSTSDRALMLVLTVGL